MTDLNGDQILIVGYGRIGKKLGAILSLLGMRVSVIKNNKNKGIDDFIEKMHYRLHFCVADEFILNGGRGSVLDVGAGTGALAEQLIKRADLILDATDISKEMLEIAKLKNIYNRSWRLL